jgi:putative DNA primase/helicase
MGVDVFEPFDPSGTSRLDATLLTAARPEAKFQPTVPLAGIAKDEIHHFSLGKPSAIWPYRNNNGLLEGYVCRFETTKQDGTSSKEFRPYRYGALFENGQTKVGWHWKGWDEKRPLYGLDELRKHLNAPVLVVEGEKKVDAANRLFPDYVAISSMNGAQSPHKSDWTPVAGRDVVIWPDHDEPGCNFAEAVTRLAAKADAASVAVAVFPPIGQKAGILQTGRQMVRATMSWSRCSNRPSRGIYLGLPAARSLRKSPHQKTRSRARFPASSRCRP